MPLKFNYVNKLDVLAALTRIDKVDKYKVKKVVLKGIYPLCFLLGWFGSATAYHVIISILSYLK